MNEEQKIKQLTRLHNISEKEWEKIINELTIWVNSKIFYKTKYGAHSEETLGVEPVPYYVDTAVEKLYSCKWEWKEEKYSLFEQLKAIAGSLMSENVRKENDDLEEIDSKIRLIPTDTEELVDLSDRYAMENEENEYEKEQKELFEKALVTCSDGDEDLSLYVTAFLICDTNDEMCNELKWDKKKLYNVHQKLYRRLIRYFHPNI
jgi:hypothetical protein